MKTDHTVEEATALDAHVYSTDEVATVHITKTGVKLNFAANESRPEVWMYVASALKLVVEDLYKHYEERMALLNSKPRGSA